MITPFLWNMLWAVLILARTPSAERSATRSGPVQESGSEQRGVLEVGEVLEYQVSYSFFDIGTIRMRVDGKEQRGSRTVYRASTIIDSEPSLSWLVDVHIRFFGVMDSSIYSLDWMGHDSLSKKVEVRTMHFDYDAGKLYLTKGERLPNGTSNTQSFDTVAVEGQSQDGLSLFFFARQHVRSSQDMHVPTYIDSTKGITDIRFRNEIEPMEIDAVDYPIETVHFTGKAGFVGVFGLTGGFEGWFSNDEARVPIVARMKVILGSIKVQLIKWKRDRWTPPRAKE